MRREATVTTVSWIPSEAVACVSQDAIDRDRLEQLRFDHRREDEC